MADFEERLRETLRRKAVAVPPKREVPPGLVRRALARIARNLSAIAIAIAIVAMAQIEVGQPSCFKRLCQLHLRAQAEVHGL